MEPLIVGIGPVFPGGIIPAGTRIVFGLPIEGVFDEHGKGYLKEGDEIVFDNRHETVAQEIRAYRLFDKDYRRTGKWLG